MFCTDSGGGSHGGSPFARIAVMTAGPDARLVCRNTADLGTRNGPLVEGQHLFLRSDKALTCIAVTTPEGRQFQEKRIAGFQSKTPPRPADAGAVAVAPVKFDSLPMGSPIVPLVNERAPVCWLEAGPFPPDTSLDDTAAAAARPVDAPPPADKSTGTVAPDTGARPSVPTDSRRVSGK